MKLMIWMARRMVSSKSSETFASFIAWVSVIGMALGVLALVVVNGVVSGFQSELAQVVSGVNGDVIVYTRGNPVNSVEEMKQKITQWSDEVVDLSPSFLAEVMIAGKSGVAGALFEGLDFDTVGRVSRIKQKLALGSWPENDREIVLGSAIATRIGVVVGDSVRVIIPFSGEALKGSTSGVSSQPLAAEAKVVGIVKLGMHQYDSKVVFTTLEWVQSLLASKGRVTNFRLKLKPSTDGKRIAERLNEYLGYPYRARHWSDLNKNIFSAIKLEKAVISLILLVIILVAAFNVVSTLMMLIHDKTADIAVLKAMGMSPKQSFLLFSVMGAWIGGVGICFGMGLGIGVNELLSRFQWIKIPSEIYYLGHLPVVVDVQSALLVAVVALFLSVVAAVFPAWRVSRLQPLEGLRRE